MARAVLTPEVKEEIRRRTDILALVGAHASLKKSGRYYKALCPFHQEKTPSFHVDPERGLWHCFGCGAGGDIYDFVMRTANLTFMEAAQELARRGGIRLETSPEAARQASERERLLRALDGAREYFQTMLASRGQKARAYLKQRGVADETTARFHLGYAPPGWEGLLTAMRARGYVPQALEQAGLAAARAEGGGYFDVFRDRLIFPIFDLQERVVAFGGRALDDAEPKYLNSKETPVFTKSRLLYALPQARKAIRERGEILVVEGYMDVLACHQFGFRHAVASLGTALTAEQVALMRRFGARVVFVYDADRAGEAATLRGLGLCEEAELSARVAVLPSGADPDAYLRRHGPEAFARVVAGALPMFDYHVEMALRRHDPGTREGKVALIDEILIVIQSVANPVRTAEYLRALAERFDLPEDALRQRLRTRTRSSRTSALDARMPALGSDRAREEAERLLLHVMVQEPARRAALARALGPEVFSTPVHQSLAAALFAVPEGDVGDVRERLDDEAAALLSRLAFEPPPTSERDKDRAVAEAVRYLTQVEPAAAARRRMWEAIKAAQASGDEAELRRLQAAYAELIAAGRRGGSAAQSAAGPE
ncbi:MAG: DNA primase [Armatimonadota bacterium]|nr:DNA primase [Armatimonadota bacterium]